MILKFSLEKEKHERESCLVIGTSSPPLAKREAESIAKYYGEKPFIGKEAVKDVVKREGGKSTAYRNIAHGAWRRSGGSCSGSRNMDTRAVEPRVGRVRKYGNRYSSYGRYFSDTGDSPERTSKTTYC